MALGDDEKWLLPENLKRSETEEVERVEAGEDRSDGDFGSYHALLKGTHPDWVQRHAVMDGAHLASYARQAAAVAGAPSPRTLLDVGCGPGALTDALRLAWPGCSAVGVEISRSAVAYAAERYPNCRFVAASVDESLRLGKSYDLVHGREFYPFTRTADPDFHRRFLGILSGLLKPKGLLLLGLLDQEKSLASTFVSLASWLPTAGLSPFDRVTFAHPAAAGRYRCRWRAR